MALEQTCTLVVRMVSIIILYEGPYNYFYWKPEVTKTKLKISI